MTRIKPFAALASIALLAACEAKIGKSGDNEAAAAANGSAEVSADGKAEEGQFSLKAPGIDLKIDIPKGLAEDANLESDGEILYPGSKLSGMHVEGGDQKGAVELRFTSVDPPDRIAAWYRDPARADQLSIGSASKQGAAYTIVGVQKSDQDPFTVRLNPASGGGTDGRLVLAERR